MRKANTVIDSVRARPAKRAGESAASCLAKRSIFTRNGNDRIYTPDPLARDIVAHFRPCGRILEPAAGGGAFLRAMPGCDWCEFDRGVDFFKCEKHYDWIVTNPPYSILTDFLKKAVEVADNIVFLCPRNSWGITSRERILAKAKFGMVESCRVPLPPAPWPQFGLVLTATWVRRGWLGSPAYTRLPSDLWAPDGSHKMVVAPPNTAPREAHADNGHCEITVKCNLGEATAVTFGPRSRWPGARYAGGTSTAKTRRATLSDLPGN
jgi:hypothetical protein